MKAHVKALPERERSVKGLADVYAFESKRVGDISREETRARGPRPRGDALQEVGLQDHWVDFSDPQEEADRAMAFANRGLARGAKVVALLPTADFDGYRKAAARSGHSEDLDRGRLSLLPMDHQLKTLRTAGAAALLVLAVQGIIQGARSEGYPETWFISKVASELLASSAPFLDLVLRVESAWSLVLRSFPVAVYCPFPLMIPSDPEFMSALVQRHSWAALGNLTIAEGAHRR